MTIEQRLLSKIEKDEYSGCWNWIGCLKPDGYGKIRVNSSKTGLAHRVSYEMFKGEIPNGLSLDHLCKNTKCCNPEHLEPVTLQENISRGTNATKTHCKHGHEFGNDNFYNYAGKRRCKTCESVRNKKYKDTK